MQNKIYTFTIAVLMFVGLAVAIGSLAPVNHEGPQAASPYAVIPGYYNVTISETGLPANTTWYIGAPYSYNGGVDYTYNTTANTSSSYNHITDFLSNGSYTIFVYTITIGSVSYVPNYAEQNGYISIIVSGTNVTDTVTFTKTSQTPVSTFYTLKLKVTNLPTVLNGVYFYWYAYIYTTTNNLVSDQTSYNSTMSFTSILTNGTYIYDIYSSSTFFTITPSSGYFEVSGHNVTISLNYAKTPRVADYNATVTEKGLPATYLFGTTIYLYEYYDQVGSNSTVISSGASVSFSLPNGTYYYVGSYSEPSGNAYYISSNYEGSFTINGTNVAVTITYQQEEFLIIKVSPNTVNTTSLDYSVETVNINNGATNTYTSNSIMSLQLLSPGTYYYYISVNGGSYKLSPTFGEFRIIDSNVTVQLNATFEQQYTVTLIEHGLPLSSGYYYWDAEVSGNGVSYSLVSDSSNVFSFSVPNGTYSVAFLYYFNIPLIPGAAYHAPNSTFTVSGKNITANVTYSQSSTAGSSSSLTTVGIPVAAGVIGVVAGAGVVAVALRRKTKAP